MILDKEVLVKMCGSNIKYYEEKGYYIPRHQGDKTHKNRLVVPKNTKILVKVEDLKDQCGEFVNVQCDYCGEQFSRRYCDIMNTRNRGLDKDSCGKPDCSLEHAREFKMVKYGTTNQREICEANGTICHRELKYTLDDAIKIFDEHGLDLCVDMIESPDYIRTTDQLPFVCRTHADKGVQCKDLDSFNRAKCCCYYGGLDATADYRRQANISDVQTACAEKDYELLTDEITTISSTIDYICNNHREYGIQHTNYYGMIHCDDNCILCARQKYSGENHWNWRGGISEEKELERHNWQYYTWRKQVYQRDDYTCQCCGIKGGTINAHHIKNFSDYPGLRYDIDNGITLCENCHALTIPGGFHNIYGVRNNTKEQLDEYIANKRKELGLISD